MTKSYSFKVEGRPKPKKRPRMTKRGRVYTPKDTLEYEEKIAEAYDGPFFEKPISMKITYTKEKQTVRIKELDEGAKTSLTFDIDNAIKATLDGLNGVAYPDDRLVYHVEAIKK